MEEWDSVAQISEAGLAVLRKIQSEIGRSLQMYALLSHSIVLSVRMATNAESLYFTFIFSILLG